MDRDIEQSLMETKAAITLLTDKLDRVRLIVEGEMGDGLASKLVIMDASLQEFKHKVINELTKLSNDISSLETEINIQNTEHVKGRWTLLTGIVAGIVSILGIVLSTMGPYIIDQLDFQHNGLLPEIDNDSEYNRYV